MREKLRRLFNRDIEYIDEYVDDVVDEAIDDETKLVIAVTVAALASGHQDKHYRIRSIRRVN